jgi:histidinol-phosphate phosphatase family protein
MGLRKAVFLDRDGLINYFPGVDKFVLSWAQFRFLPRAGENTMRLKEAGFFLALVTNQSGVGRGLMPLAELENIHARMQEALGAGRMDAIYYCPHSPSDRCICRKPSPVLIFKACRDHGLDPAQSYFIGDSPRDIQAGLAAGCRTVLCGAPVAVQARGQGQPSAIHVQPHQVCETFSEAVDWILAQERLSPSPR